MVPPDVNGLECIPSEPGDLILKWEEPWTGIPVEKYSIWIQILREEHFTTKTYFHKKGFQIGNQLDIWVRPISGTYVGGWGKRVLCNV